MRTAEFALLPKTVWGLSIVTVAEAAAAVFIKFLRFDLVSIMPPRCVNVFFLPEKSSYQFNLVYQQAKIKLIVFHFKKLMISALPLSNSKAVHNSFFISIEFY